MSKQEIYCTGALKKKKLSQGVIRVTLYPGDADPFEPVAFSDASGTFLTQTGFRCNEQPVTRALEDGGYETEVIRRRQLN